MTEPQYDERRSSADEDHIAGTVMTCIAHWRMRDVPDDRIEDMREELEDHLREVSDRGGTVESVVGDDTTAFAEEWAREARSERSFLGWTLEVGDALAFNVVLVATAYHLITWSLTFEVVAALSVMVLVLAWFAVDLRISGLAKKDGKRFGWKSFFKGLALMPLFWGPFLVAWAVTGERGAELFEWHWTYTLAALGIQIVLGRLSKAIVGQK